MFKFHPLSLLLAAAVVPCAAATPHDYVRYVNLRHATGIDPMSSPIEGPDGMMYGTTTQGVERNGAVYRVDSRHQLEVLHAFAADDSEGGWPTPLTLGSDGWLYGGTQFGTIRNHGVIFRVSTSGQYQTVCQLGATGWASGPLVRDDQGNIYASLLFDGVGGAIARIAPDCSQTVLHEFQGGADGARAIGGLTLGPDGHLYGIARDDGTGSSGTVFTIGMDGSGYAVLHEFVARTEGCASESPLVVGADGALYGSTPACGPHLDGTLFRMTTAGDFSVLHVFSDTDPLGDEPAGMSVGPDGTLYGVTSDGGAKRGGTVFKMNPRGKGTLMHSFNDYPSTTDGSRPYAAPTITSTGEVWGTTFAGGHYDLGTIYTFGVGR